ncbi:RNA polymerase sigma factor [Anaerobacillus alkaliphilus]|uniref:RNA polymerase sigma factor n=1 Tax=Anaerobacillus alkaliphilus TaxID=1548597 RepID=A0A4Q0VPW7_9BACI|nr:RNA polymerase sigma factor [Anaerobacillus alkaliphilus]RXI96385.1 RNA polymerase sigma factor [Anaerobacillus alkaliphilus]
MDEELRQQRVHEWYQLYSDEIYRYILFMIGDHDQAKDLTQDTYLKAYHSYDQFLGITSDKNWLYRLARNVTIDYIRKRKPIRFMMESFGTYPSKDNTPEEVIEMGEKVEELYRCLKKLKRSYQEVIILRKIKELSISETTEILGWNEQKVKNTLLRALSALKQQMLKEGYQHETL